MKAFRNNHSLNKSLLLMALTAVLTVSAVTGTLAWLTSVSTLPNMFGVVTDVKIAVTEDFHQELSSDNWIKENVAIQNQSEAEVYIRAKVLTYWKDKNTGNLLATSKPVSGTDYLMDLNLNGTGDSGYWFQFGDYYYFSQPVDELEKSVNSNGEEQITYSSTENLIKSCYQKAEKDTKILTVEIVAEGFQAGAPSAVEEAWKIKVASDGSLVAQAPGTSSSQGGSQS